MKKIKMTIATAVTALSLTVPALAAPVKTNVYCNEKLNYLTKITQNGLCNFGNKSELMEYILKNYVSNGNQNSGSENDECDNGSCNSPEDCTGNGNCIFGIGNNGCVGSTGNNNCGNTGNNGSTGGNGNTGNNGSTGGNGNTGNNGNTGGNGNTGNNGNTGGNGNTGNNGNTGGNGNTGNNGSTGGNGNTGNNGSTGGNGGNQNTPGTSVSNYASRVVELVNEERAKEGLSPLSMDSRVAAAAAIRAEEIKTNFSHTRPNGTTCFTALDQAGASYNGAGENIASGQRTPEAVVTAWMNSEGHRKNIMNSKFKYIGVAYSDRAWVQMFTY